MACVSALGKNTLSGQIQNPKPENPKQIQKQQIQM